MQYQNITFSAIAFSQESLSPSTKVRGTPASVTLGNILSCGDNNKAYACVDPMDDGEEDDEEEEEEEEDDDEEEDEEEDHPNNNNTMNNNNDDDDNNAPRVSPRQSMQPLFLNFSSDFTPSRKKGRPKKASGFRVNGVNLLNRNNVDSKTVIERIQKRRANHNDVERRRRDIMNNTILELAKVIPNTQQRDQKLDKATILKLALQHIVALQTENQRLAAVVATRSRHLPSDPNNPTHPTSTSTTTSYPVSQEAHTTDRRDWPSLVNRTTPPQSPMTSAFRPDDQPFFSSHAINSHVDAHPHAYPSLPPPTSMPGPACLCSSQQWPPHHHGRTLYENSAYHNGEPSQGRKGDGHNA